MKKNKRLKIFIIIVIIIICIVFSINIFNNRNINYSKAMAISKFSVWYEADQNVASAIKNYKGKQVIIEAVPTEINSHYFVESTNFFNSIYEVYVYMSNDELSKLKESQDYYISGKITSITSDSFTIKHAKVIYTEDVCKAKFEPYVINNMIEWFGEGTDTTSISTYMNKYSVHSFEPSDAAYEFFKDYYDCFNSFKTDDEFNNFIKGTWNVTNNDGEEFSYSFQGNNSYEETTSKNEKYLKNYSLIKEDGDIKIVYANNYSHYVKKINNDVAVFYYLSGYDNSKEPEFILQRN